MARAAEYVRAMVAAGCVASVACVLVVATEHARADGPAQRRDTSLSSLLRGAAPRLDPGIDELSQLVKELQARFRADAATAALARATRAIAEATRASAAHDDGELSRQKQLAWAALSQADRLIARADAEAALREAEARLAHAEAEAAAAEAARSASAEQLSRAQGSLK